MNEIENAIYDLGGRQFHRSKPAPREFIYAVARELKSKGPEDE